MRRSSTVWRVGLVVAAAAIGAWYWHARDRTPADVMVIAGGDAGGLPRAEAITEGFDTGELQAAAQLAREQQSAALLVMRHEHLVFEQYGAGGGADVLVDGGEFAATLAALAAGIAVAQNGMPAAAVPVPGAEPLSDTDRMAVAIAKASGVSYLQFLSNKIWRPLNAAPAQYSAITGSLSARASDWLRVAALLLQDGRFEGTQVVPRGWVQRIRLPSVDREVFLLRGPGATRLWLVPRLDLAVLRVSAPTAVGAVDETRLPGMLVSSVRDRPAASGSTLSDLVPGH